MKTVALCGDLIWDTHVARLPRPSPGYYQPQANTQLAARHGGAWYIGQLMAAAFAAMKIDAHPEAPIEVPRVDVEEGKGLALGVARGFSVWERFVGAEKPAKAKASATGDVTYTWGEGEAQPATWRIKEFLGCEKAPWDRTGTRFTGFPGFSPGVDPDVVVIDDLGLGFSRHRDAWPGWLGRLRDGVPVVIKAAPPFDTPLWRDLAASKPERPIIAILSAGALRDAGVELSRGLSWDQTREDLVAAFGKGRLGEQLRCCSRVYVILGRSAIAVFTRVERAPTFEQPATDRLRFERLTYDPATVEGGWGRDLPGITFGTASVAVVSVVADLLRGSPVSSHVTASRALAMARDVHLAGGGHEAKGITLDAVAVRWKDHGIGDTKGFRSAFDASLLGPEPLQAVPAAGRAPRPSILSEIVGDTTAALLVVAEDVVRFGHKRALAGAPRLVCGSYVTFDREEIERLNTVRDLVEGYRANPADTRPLSIAVFGAPGSGKSHAIRELATELLGKGHERLVFNLSQFEGVDDLCRALHQVRDASVKGRMPLVFWDEFDSMRGDKPLGWLKEFLAPMQDAEFLERGRVHPIGKCLFVFAGGTRHTFGEFALPLEPTASKDEKDAFAAVKGGDFVSRLRGHVDIKGPNASDEYDHVHVLRRALLLRAFVERHHNASIDPGTGELSMCPYLLRAFLTVGDGTKGEGYRHGARSLESIVSMSRLAGQRSYGPSELPGGDVVAMHAAPDFLGKLRDREFHLLEAGQLDELAREQHESWRTAKAKKGYVRGDVRDDNASPPTHPLMVPYDEMDPANQDRSRAPARLALTNLERLGYRVVHRAPAPGSAPVVVDPADNVLRARSEHRRWMRECLARGFTWAKDSDDGRMVHKDLCDFDRLHPEEAKLDHELVDAISRFLSERGLSLAKVGGAS